MPLLLLGGGGYNEIATVKAWVASSAAACGVHLPSSVPLNEFYADYGPTFRFEHVSAASFAWKHLPQSVALKPFLGLQRLHSR
jgi:hypothetical protein